MSADEGLPVGWAWAPLADLLTGIETGKSFKCEERPPNADEVGVVKVSAVSWGEYQEQESKTCTDAARINPSLFVQAGDFLFSRANTIELVGACVIARQVMHRVMLSDKILRFKFFSEAMKPWVLNLLRSRQGRLQIETLASGNQDSMRNIGQERIGQILVPLPPEAEQTRIVEKLEELLSDLDAGVAELKAAQRKLTQYRQSLLKAAVEGALTADWRAARETATTSASSSRRTPGSSTSPSAEQRQELDPGVRRDDDQNETGTELLQRILIERRARWEAKQQAKFVEQGKTPPAGWRAKYSEPLAPDASDLPALPNGWVWASLDQLSDIQGGIQKQPSRKPVANKYPFLRVANVARGKLKLDDIHEIELFDGELTRLTLQKGDVLIVEGNGSLTEIGRCALWDGSVENAVHQNHLIRARPILMESEFVEAWLNSLGGIERLTKLAATTSGLFTLSVGKISRIPVPLPPLEEQRVAVIVMRNALDEQSRQESAVFQSLKQAAAQRKNILKAAFAGQLVPQDPFDEPASVLLARIRAERVANTTKRGRKAKEPSHA